MGQAAIAQKTPLPRIVIVLECEEESGSHDLLHLLDAMKVSISGSPCPMKRACSPRLFSVRSFPEMSPISMHCYVLFPMSLGQLLV
jgi:hypothetical protein